MVVGGMVVVVGGVVVVVLAVVVVECGFLVVVVAGAVDPSTVDAIALSADGAQVVFTTTVGSGASATHELRIWDHVPGDPVSGTTRLVRSLSARADDVSVSMDASRVAYSSVVPTGATARFRVGVWSVPWTLGHAEPPLPTVGTGRFELPTPDPTALVFHFDGPV